MPLRAELGSPRRTGQRPTPTPTHQGSAAPRHTRRQARVQASSSSRRWSEEPTTRRRTTMAEDRMAVLDMLRKATADGNVDVLREGVRVLAEAIMEAEVGE